MRPVTRESLPMLAPVVDRNRDAVLALNILQLTGHSVSYFNFAPSIIPRPGGQPKEYWLVDLLMFYELWYF